MIMPYWQNYPLSNVTYAGVARWTQNVHGVDGSTASSDTRLGPPSNSPECWIMQSDSRS